MKIRIKFEGIEKLHPDDREMIDYGLVAMQSGNPSCRFVENDGEYSIYKVRDNERFERELKSIEALFGVRIVREEVKMDNAIKNIIEDTLEEMAKKVDNSLERTPTGMDGLELEEMKEELKMCLYFLRKK